MDIAPNAAGSGAKPFPVSLVSCGCTFGLEVIETDILGFLISASQPRML